jgi:hypothetical protein
MATTYPLFLDLEGSSYDEDSYPIAAAWSLPNGDIKSVLIVPEDDWTDWDHGTLAARGITREHLYEQGFSALDVVREMMTDFADATVYVDGVDYDQELVERLFEAYGEEPNFEVRPVGEYLQSFRFGSFMDYREQFIAQKGLSPFEAETNVLAMLTLAHELAESDQEQLQD